MKEERINEIWGVFFLLLGVYTLASLIFYEPMDIAFFTAHPNNPPLNYTGMIGVYISFGLMFSFGASAYIIPVIFLLWSWSFFKQSIPEKKFLKFVGLTFAIFSLSTLLSLCVEPDNKFGLGGALGYIASSYLFKYFGLVGGIILTSAVLLLSLLLTTDYLLYPLMVTIVDIAKAIISYTHEFSSRLTEWIGAIIEKRREAKKSYEQFYDEDAEVKKPKKQKQKKPEKVKQTISEEISKRPIKVKEYRPEGMQEESLQEAPKKAPKPKKLNAPKPVTQEAAPEKKEDSFEGVVSGAENESEYQLPSPSLLVPPTIGEKPQENLEENSRIIEQTLAEFGIEVKVMEIEQGPVITRYELLPAPGVKVNSINNLSDDLSLALKAPSIRMIIPIPGKSAVGIEVPNSVKNMVYLKELIESSDFKSKKCALPLVLGKDSSGKPMIADLAEMPHILIAGSTGSGKTVSVNAIINGLMYALKPNELKFVMVDPKMVEMNVYNKIPHMLTPVVTDVKKAAGAINWVVEEMEKRYRLLATVGVRNIASFNEREISDEDRAEMEKKDSDSIIPTSLPYIVVIIDELADLMMTMRDKVEAPICRLAQLARAVGIHLILATQRPSVDVITGVIKANFPARLSFKVSSKVDSRTVLDGMGAEKLLGKGDLLFLKPGTAKPIRGQAPFVADKEINGVVDFVGNQGAPQYAEELQKAQSGSKSGASGNTDKDELYDEALAIVLETKQASASFLQRRLRLGFSRAARIIDQMEMEGVIGPAQGSKPREIYIESYSEEPADTFEEETEEIEEEV